VASLGTRLSTSLSKSWIFRRSHYRSGARHSRRREPSRALRSVCGLIQAHSTDTLRFEIFDVLQSVEDPTSNFDVSRSFFDQRHRSRVRGLNAQRRAS
jgi:hypothetical protein